MNNHTTIHNHVHVFVVVVVVVAASRASGPVYPQRILRNVVPRLAGMITFDFADA